MDDGDHKQSTPFAPYFRIWLCGAFRVERRVGAAYEVVRTSEWGGSSYPRLLLKALLCCPGRQARREALIDLLWPEADYEQATQYLNTATTKLRKVLQSVSAQESLLMTGDDCQRYQLGGQSFVWVDGDAALTLLKEAERLGRISSEALLLLEEADSYFSHGAFLQDEEGHWAAGRRATVEQARYRCRLWLSEAYEQQGMAGQAETVLSLLLEEDPFDEDVLYRLMVLLHGQDMTHQALRLYDRSCEAFTREGIEPTESLKQLAIRLSEERHKRATSPRFEMHVIPNFSYRTAHDLLEADLILEGNIMDQLRRQILVQLLQGSGGTLLALHNLALGSEIAERLTRPQSLARREMVFHDEEILSVGAAFLPILWRLYFDGRFSEIKLILPSSLSQLALLARQPSQYQQQAAGLASKAHQLACMLALQEQDYGAALIHVEQAYHGASIADDAQLLVASLIRKALTYRYINRYLKKCPHQILETYQEAMQYRTSISSLLLGRLYTGLAEAYSELEQEYESKQSLDQAYRVFPENPQDDPNFSYTHFKLPKGFEVVMYLNLKQAEKAWEVLTKIDTSVPMAVVPDRVELSLDQARASLLLGDLTQSCKYVEMAATSAVTLGSHLRYHEAYSIYKQVQLAWPNEPQVKELAGQFRG